MNHDVALDILRQAGAVLDGHFQLTSGRHAARYIQCARLFEAPEFSEKLCADLAEQLRGARPEIVVGPALGGIIIAYELARALGVRGIFAERENGEFTLRRGFALKPGVRVVVAEDVVTTGGSVREVIEVVRKLGGEVVAVAAVADRSDGKVDFGVPFASVLRLDVPSWEADACPLCHEGVPIYKPGSRAAAQKR